MGSNPVPTEVALAVAAFVWARAHDPLPARASAEEIDQRWVDSGLVRDHQRAVELGHAMTADNLAYTLLIAAARFAGHRDYQEQWRAWTPFGGLEPGSTTDGPTASG